MGDLIFCTVELHVLVVSVTLLVAKNVTLEHPISAWELHSLIPAYLRGSYLTAPTTVCQFVASE